MKTTLSTQVEMALLTNTLVHFKPFILALQNVKISASIRELRR
jgi:hypothetical protein